MAQRELQAHFTDLIGLDNIDALAERWQDDLAKKAEGLMRRLAFRWHAEAVKRAPVKTGMLRNTLLHNIFYESGSARFGPIVAEVGTNISEPEPYGEFVEFGTKRIAGGAVLAIGPRPDVDDFDAVHTWPAKEFDATAETSHEIVHNEGLTGVLAFGASAHEGLGSKIKTGNFRGRLLNEAGELLKARPQEQMPWLRPAFFHIRDWVMKELRKLFELGA